MAWKETNFDELARSLGSCPAVAGEQKKLEYFEHNFLIRSLLGKAGWRLPIIKSFNLTKTHALTADAANTAGTVATGIADAAAITVEEPRATANTREGRRGPKRMASHMW